ncbi:cyclic nucleotide-gated cation channel-like, partial [Stegodyphus dumicola]|uniref:cyclic nucleotide-gated cation channel-like n=1 Tax=Stegodyphus dumicola TaxID=202533 RepID=UPI0015B0DB6C
ETGKVLTQMKAGDFFGEIGILNLDGFNRRTADVRSVGYSELFSLSREDILAAMKDYPEAQDILQTMGRKRLMEARLAANVGKSGANTAEANLPSTKKGQSDGGRKGALKSRTAVSKLKEDVRSLKKLLRSRSTPTGKSGDSEENVEMKPIPASREKVITITEKQPGRRNASIRKLMRRMHLKGEDGSSGVKVLTGRLASFRSKPGRLIGESTSISTESSADSATPLNKGLPLLQRVRMLGEQERRAAATQGAAPTSPQNGANAPSEIIGEESVFQYGFNLSVIECLFLKSFEVTA